MLLAARRFRGKAKQYRKSIGKQIRLDAAFAFRYDRRYGIAQLMVLIASPLVH